MNQRNDDDDEYLNEPRRRRRDEEYLDEPRRRRRDEDDYPEERRNRRRDYDDDDDRYDRRPAMGDDIGMRMLLPVGRSGWAIAAGYLGLISVLCIPSPFALMAGILAIREMRRNPKKHGMGRAIFGIVMGGIGTVAMVLGILSAIIKAGK